MLATSIEFQTPEVELWFSGAVAAGTLALAFATGWLARKTRDVARQTAVVARETQALAKETAALARRTAEDVESQFRPALVVDNDHERSSPAHHVMGTLTLRIRNSGHGPALDVKAVANPGDVGAAGWNRGAIPTDRAVAIEFAAIRPGSDGRIIVFLEYGGLNQMRYTTRISVNCAGNAFADDVTIEPVPPSGCGGRSLVSAP
jgi:hypothetical protein